MLDRRWLLDHLDDVAAMLAARGAVTEGLATIRELDAERRRLLGEAEMLRHERKQRSDEIGRAKKAGEDTAAAQATVRLIGERIAAAEAALAEVLARLDTALLEIPNMPLAEVPRGSSAADNVVVRSWGEPLAHEAWMRPHWETGEALGILDMERAAAVSGARFVFMRGLGARLERVLVDYMMDDHAAHGYTEIIPPYLVRAHALSGTGQLPKFEAELFRTTGSTPYYLIPTAEVPVTNLLRETILDGDALPQRYVAFSPCFRAEAGAAGQDTRGMIRVHQFHKVELVHFEKPESSRAALDDLVARAEAILRALQLPYRVLQLCTGDLGFSSALTFDLEVWLPGQQRWLEISSCSTFTDFQARRAGIRYRPTPQAKPEFVHTLNGSGLAIGRTVVAILENYQRPDGSVVVPEVLRDRLGADKIKA